MVEIQISFRIEEEIAHKLKLKAVIDKTTQKALIRQYIEDGLAKDENQTKLEVNTE